MPSKLRLDSNLWCYQMKYLIDSNDLGAYNPAEFYTRDTEE